MAAWFFAVVHGDPELRVETVMCGIAGRVSVRPDDNLTDSVARMTDRMSRRGPDGHGLKVWSSAVFGHRRLAILDLSDRGSQPMTSEDGNLGLVFNGCIYNFIELRDDLIDEGATFRSSSDTEVLLRGFESWGLNRLLERLRGMYAFAVWDASAERLTLVRDRLGVKPLAYCEQNGQIAFASTVSALRVGGCGGDIDTSAILDYLKLGFIPDDTCVYEGIKKLAPASILEWSPTGSTIRSYWSLPEQSGGKEVSFAEATERTEELFLDAVRVRLHSDVPMGALLSSGIDSALVCWAASQFKSDLTAFTVSTPGDPEDETSGARETARILGIRHEVVEISPDHSGVLDELVTAYGEPFACSSATAMLRVSEAVKSHATVLLTGDGGDDVFLGYPFFRNFYLSQSLARALPGNLLKLWPQLRSVLGSSSLSRLRHFGDYTCGGLDAVLNVRDGLRGFRERGLLGTRFHDIPNDGAWVFTDPYGRRVLDDVIAYAQSTWFTGEFLNKVDGGSMHHAIEARSPFLDDRLWNFAATLAPSVRLRGFRVKAILRELTQRHLGAAVAERPKQGFSIPVERWLTKVWRGGLTSMREGSVLVRDGWVREDALRNEIDRSLSCGEATPHLWRLVVLEKWLVANGHAG